MNRSNREQFVEVLSASSAHEVGALGERLACAGSDWLDTLVEGFQAGLLGGESWAALDGALERLIARRPEPWLPAVLDGPLRVMIGWEVAQAIRDNRWLAARFVRLAATATALEQTEDVVEVLYASCCGFPEVAGYLCHILEDRTKPEAVRGRAAEALEHAHDFRTTGALLAGLYDPSPDVRFWCAFALGGRGTVTAVPRLLWLALTDFRQAPTMWRVSREAIWNVGRIAEALIDRHETRWRWRSEIHAFLEPSISRLWHGIGSRGV